MTSQAAFPNKCGEEGPVGLFYKHEGATDGLRSAYKVCSGAAQVKYRAANPEKVAAYIAKHYAARKNAPEMPRTGSAVYPRLDNEDYAHQQITHRHCQ